MMKIDQRNCPLPLRKDFIAILEKEMDSAGVTGDQPVYITFCDDDYDPRKGGFHPVEIRLDAHGRIEYVTDFAYVGSPPFAELAKELDFDCSLGLFQQFGRESQIAEGREMFAIWQENFVAYHSMGVYKVLVTVDGTESC